MLPLRSWQQSGTPHAQNPVLGGLYGTLEQNSARTAGSCMQRGQQKSQAVSCIHACFPMHAINTRRDRKQRAALHSQPSQYLNNSVTSDIVPAVTSTVPIAATTHYMDLTINTPPLPHNLPQEDCLQLTTGHQMQQLRSSLSSKCNGPQTQLHHQNQPQQQVMASNTVFQARPQQQQPQQLTGKGSQAEMDQYFMHMALEQARTAATMGEVPVGAVIVAADGQTVLAVHHNTSHTSQNPVAHAELQAISCAAQRQGSWRLLGATLYSTLEPCPMCAGAILQSRIKRLVYAARQQRLGADGSWVQLFPPPVDNESRRPWVRIPKPFPSDVTCNVQTIQGAHSSTPDGTAHEDISVDMDDEQPQFAGYVAGGCVDGSGLRSGPETEQEAGVVSSQRRHPFHNQITVTRGVLEAESAELLRTFFRSRRVQKSMSGLNVSCGSDKASAEDVQSAE